jgi:hypothetical protein
MNLALVNYPRFRVIPGFLGVWAGGVWSGLWAKGSGNQQLTRSGRESTAGGMGKIRKQDETYSWVNTPGCLLASREFVRSYWLIGSGFLTDFRQLVINTNETRWSTRGNSNSQVSTEGNVNSNSLPICCSEWFPLIESNPIPWT